MSAIELPNWRKACVQALEFLQRPGSWTQRTNGIYEDGTEVSIRDLLSGNRNPQCLCVYAAFFLGAGRAFPDDQKHAEHAARAAVSKFREMFGTNPVWWNDAFLRTQGDVVERLPWMIAIV